MMFERYDMQFGPKKNRPSSNKKTSESAPTKQDMTFDRQLRQHMLEHSDDADIAEQAADARSTTLELTPEMATDARTTADLKQDAKAEKKARRKALRKQAKMSAMLEEVSATPAPAPEPEPEMPEQSSADIWRVLNPVWKKQRHRAQNLRHKSGPVKHATDALRTQLLQQMKAKGWKRIAISAPTSGCGTTYTALNLALSLSSIPDLRTVLIDLNQRQPGLANALGYENAEAISDMLLGRVPFQDYLLRLEENLAVAMNALVSSNPAELLHAQSTRQVLDEIDRQLEPDMVIYDMPPMLEHDDLAAFLPQVDGVLLVADGTKTLGQEIANCQVLLEDRVPLLGVVLNRGRVSAKAAKRW